MSFTIPLKEIIEVVFFFFGAARLFWDMFLIGILNSTLTFVEGQKYSEVLKSYHLMNLGMLSTKKMYGNDMNMINSQVQNQEVF